MNDSADEKSYPDVPEIAIVKPEEAYGYRIF
jgi:hypothetical protein